MEKQIVYKEIISRKQMMDEVRVKLKEEFIGLDYVIDEVINLVLPWYAFPQAQLRPTVINLWGMTGSGKTALVQKLVELLDYKRLYAQSDMGEFESDSASWYKQILTDELEYFHEKPCVICFDEFQMARTLNKDGDEMGKDKLRVIWDLLDSGKIGYIPSNSIFYIKRADACINNLLKAESKGVRISNAVVVNGEDDFCDIFRGFYFENNGRNNETLDKNYFLSKDFKEGLFYLFNDDDVVREILDEEISKCDLRGLIDLINRGLKTRTALKELDLSKALIFILGNLDEAYNMSHSINPDINADELYEATLKINVTDIKAALKKRFRFEQIARLGNNHVIYRAFRKIHFEELIERQLKRINEFVIAQFGIKINYHDSVKHLVYREGVFPAQGTRPVLTTIKNLVESYISKITIEVIERGADVEAIDWMYCDDKYVFVLKDSSNSILNIYEEKVSLKIDVLRKVANRDVQAHTAVHESGHAVLAALTLRIIPSIVVSKTAADGCEGFCMVNYPEGVFTREVLKKEILIALGGFVAEKMIFGKEHTSSGVTGDIETVSLLANRAIRQYAMGSDPVDIAVYSATNSDSFYMEEKYKQEAMKLVKEAEREAQILLANNKLLLLKMSEYLTDNYKMEEKLIRDFVIKFGKEEWIKQEGFKTKENYFSFETEIKKQIAELSEEQQTC